MILLCLMPDDFTHQLGESCGTWRVDGFNKEIWTLTSTSDWRLKATVILLTPAFLNTCDIKFKKGKGIIIGEINHPEFGSRYCATLKMGMSKEDDPAKLTIQSKHIM